MKISSPSIETGGAEELEDVAMEGVRAGFGNDVDDAAGEATVLGVDIALERMQELGNRVEFQSDASLLTDGLLNTRAVQVMSVI